MAHKHEPSEAARQLRDELFGDTLDIHDAAYVLGISEWALSRYRREGRIAAVPLGRRGVQSYRFDKDEIRRFAREGAQDAGT